MLNLISISKIVDDGFDAIQNVADEIQIKIKLPSTPDSERDRLRLFYIDVKNVSPLSASGYFDIGKRTLVSMLSVREVSYLILFFKFFLKPIMVGLWN